MAYILTKKSKIKREIRNLYYMVRSYRDRGKVKRETLFKMGEAGTIDEFLNELAKQREILEIRVKDCEKDMSTQRFPSNFLTYVLKTTKRELVELEQLRIKVVNIEADMKCSAKVDTAEKLWHYTKPAMKLIKKGRPAITDKKKDGIVQKLEPYLKAGLSVKKACIQAQVPKSTVYELMQKDSAFADQIKRYEQYLSTLFSSSVTFQLHSLVAKQLMGKQIDQLDFNFMKWFAQTSKHTRDEFGVSEHEDLKRQWDNLNETLVDPD